MIWERIYKHLNSEGIAVYPPGQKTGEVKGKYVVVRDSGTTNLTEISSKETLYDVLCYVPKEEYSQLEDFTISVKKAMDGLFPLIRPTHFETPSFYDDTSKSHMISVQYRNYKKKVRY